MTPGVHSVALLFLWLLLMRSQSHADIQNCNFDDTVNLTESKQFSNGSYLYEGVVIPPELVGVYDYVELFEGTRQPVPAHTRGCACKLKKCVKFCCHPTKIKVDDSWECAQQLSEELEYSPFVNITLANNSRIQVHALDEFVLQQGIPCHDGYALSPLQYKEDKWELFENGTLLRLFDQAYFTKRDYCLTPHKFNGTYVLNPLNCPVENEVPDTVVLNSTVMMISVPFLIATILVYGLIPQLRNLHGKCLICYLISLAIGYTMLVIASLRTVNFSHAMCSALGFIAYYFLMAAFFWLSVICFDLWHNFRGATGSIHHILQRKRFYVYLLYGWGLPAPLTIITVLCQLSNMDYALKPGIGEYCWLKTNDWSAMIYFYGPNLVIIIVNIIMFVLTTNKIYKIKKELERITDREENRQNLRSQQDNTTLFLRLFIVMGVAWLLEVISYMVGPFNRYFIVSDIYNAAQGVIIFVLFVLKPKVLALIKRRINNLGHGNLHYSSKRSTSLGVTSTSSTRF